MTFEVETGSASTTSTSYASVLDADLYFGQFGNQNWQPTDLTAGDGGAQQIADKQLALNRATRALDTIFGQRFRSAPVTQVQALLFPRFPFYINGWQVLLSNSIPRLLKDATCEVAVIALNSNSATGDDGIYPDLNQSSVLRSATVKIGDLMTKNDYDDASSAETLTGFLKIERILAPLLTSLNSSPTHLGL